jgi:Tol biopolymer transport system component
VARWTWLLVAVMCLLATCGRGTTTLHTAPKSIPSVPVTLVPVDPTITTLPAMPTTAVTVPAGDPCTRPDRTRILFDRRLPGSEPIEHVFSVNADGSCLAQLTHGTTHVLNWGASWSPDGRHIAFIRKDAGVMVADWDGSHERLLLAETKVQPSGAHTDWSPDGTRIVASREDGVWVVDALSGAATHVAGDINAGYACWSPDGKQVAYGEVVNDRAVVSVVNADGSGHRVVADRASQPDWGVNNRIVYFDGNEMQTVKPDGSDLRAVPGSANTGAPRWNADATRIVGSIGSGGMKVFDPDKGFLFVVNTGAGADASGGTDYDDDW